MCSHSIFDNASLSIDSRCFYGCCHPCLREKVLFKIAFYGRYFLCKIEKEELNDMSLVNVIYFLQTKP